MPRSFAKRLDTIKPSITLAMNAKAFELRAKGVDVIAFGVGEPDFEPPQEVLEHAKKAIDLGASKYTAVTGIAELKKAIAKECLRRRGYEPKTSEICVSVGAKHALFNLALALYEEGDEVIIPSPYWVSYPEQVRMMGATPIHPQTTLEDAFKLTPEALEKVFSPRTKAVLFCTPSNPTGSAYSKEELLALAKVLRKHDAWILLDEIYSELVYDDFESVSLLTLAPDLRDRIIVIDGVSKTYAMTGWRIGWSIGPENLTQKLDMLQGQSTTNATAVAQYAATSALTGPRTAFLEMRQKFQTRRNLMLAELSAIPHLRYLKPEGAFYVFVDFNAYLGSFFRGKPIHTEEDLALLLLEEAHVASIPCGTFGTPGYLRFSYATSEERIIKGVKQLAQTLSEFKKEPV